MNSINLLDSLIDFNLPAIRISDVDYAKVVPIKWYPSDTEEKWLEGKQKFGKDWVYYDSEIIYHVNELHYRGPMISSITDDNFFISYGCSNTFGVGIHLEDTYTDMVSKHLNLNYLNFGVGGGSQNLIWMNSVLATKNLTHVPKFVIIQWPSTERLAALTPHGLKCFQAHWDDTKTQGYDLYRSLVLNEKFMINQAKFFFESTNTMWKLKNVKIINFTLDPDVSKLFNIKWIKVWPEKEELLARDQHHPGKIHNELFADFVLEQLD